MNNEPWIQRIDSHTAAPGREDTFRNEIRARDERCVISGIINRCAPFRWTSFEAARIFVDMVKNWLLGILVG